MVFRFRKDIKLYEKHDETNPSPGLQKIMTEKPIHKGNLIFEAEKTHDSERNRPERAESRPI